MTSPSGYSDKPLAAKLGYKPGMHVYVRDPPPNYMELLGAIPDGIAFDTGIRTGTALVHMFSPSFDDLRRCLSEVTPELSPDAMIWVSWPKKSSGVVTDLSEDRVRELAFPLGLVDVKVCAVDATWSALKLVRRKALR